MSAQEFQPAFKRVQQENDFDCAFACIAMIAGKTLAEVKKTAIEKCQHPAHGPYAYMDEMLLAKLLGQHGYVGTVYKQSTGIASLPDVAIGLVCYDEEKEIGRHALFHRQFAGTKNALEYIIDPAYWIPVEKQVRIDIKGFPVAWYIGVTPMNPTVKK